MINLIPTLAAIDPATAEKIADYAIKAPITLIAFALLFGLGYLGRWLITKFWPEWQAAQEKRRLDNAEEAEKTRKHMTEVLNKRGEEAAVDIAREREVATMQHRAIVDGISGRLDNVHGRLDTVHNAVGDVSDKVDKVDARLSGIHDVVRALASKQGVGVVLMLLLAGAGLGLITSRHIAAAMASSASSFSCPGGCRSPEYCCAANTCCRNVAAGAVGVDVVEASKTPKEPREPLSSKPHSAAVVVVDYGDDNPFLVGDALAKSTL